MQNYHNPFNPSTVITFDIPERTQVTLAVYDVRGRLIRTFLPGEIDAGQHLIHWDGRDRSGNGVDSGVYFCKLSSPERSFSRKMILIR